MHVNICRQTKYIHAHSIYLLFEDRVSCCCTVFCHYTEFGTVRTYLTYKSNEYKSITINIPNRSIARLVHRQISDCRYTHYSQLGGMQRGFPLCKMYVYLYIFFFCSQFDFAFSVLKTERGKILKILCGCAVCFANGGFFHVIHLYSQIQQNRIIYKAR